VILIGNPRVASASMSMAFADGEAVDARSLLEQRGSEVIDVNGNTCTIIM